MKVVRFKLIESDGGNFFNFNLFSFPQINVLDNLVPKSSAFFNQCFVDLLLGLSHGCLELFEGFLIQCFQLRL